MRPWQTLAVLLGMSLATEVAAQSALQLYRSGDYDRACPRFEAVTRRRPQDGAAWAELAMCEERRGNGKKARRANMLAVRWGNEQTRKSAYLSLWRMNEGVKLPPLPDAASPKPGAEGPRGCLALRPAPELECTGEVRACVYGSRGLGARGAGHNLYVKLEPCEGRCELQLRPPEAVDPQHLDVERARSFEGNRLRLSRNIPESRCEQFVLVQWAESTGRCGGDCSSEGMHTACDAGSLVYKYSTADKPKP